MSYECLKAILDDCRNDNHLSWSYISRVLSEKYHAGVRTKEDYDEARAQFRAMHSQKGDRKKPAEAPRGFERIDF